MKNLYHNLNKKVFYISFTLSILLIIASFIVPPTGVISSSVLAAVGEIFAFATLGTVISAIERGADVTLKHGETEVTLDNPNTTETK